MIISISFQFTVIIMQINNYSDNPISFRNQESQTLCLDINTYPLFHYKHLYSVSLLTPIICLIINTYLLSHY
jgi:hypothetical protein